ncbi:DNA-directed RNA polymerase subunit H [Candidatus Woesearchaeota archaeon]|nr:DNA-directed RNA polymerase subunit H [Candidatus Woesearchaeota archaeon]
MAKVDVRKHVLVPKHVKLSEKEKEEVLKAYSATIENFPRILKKDPALEGLNVKYGDLIRIERKSPTAGKTVFYRTVVLS